MRSTPASSRRYSLSSWLCLGALAASCAACGPVMNADAGDAGASDARGDAGTPPRDSESPLDEGPPPANRDFLVRARGMMTHQGRAMGVWLIDATGRHVMGYQQLASITEDQFDLRMPDLVPEGDYTADVYVDANGNGSYDGPGTDPSWRVPVPTTGSAMVAVMASSSVTNLNDPPRVPRRDAVINLAGFTMAEAGQRFELRVIDRGSRATVGGYATPQLPGGGTLAITLPGIIEEGGEYDVDFWVDADSSGTYGGPGQDHTWRAMGTATGAGLSVSWTRSDSYVELDWR